MANISSIKKDFPSVFVSKISVQESWRKQLYRPTYHIHKWWAIRLGSVFRSIILGALSEKPIEKIYDSRITFPKKVIFDPFMGSGTTIGEGLKLGCNVIGWDINPIPVLMNTVSLTKYERNEIVDIYQKIYENVGKKIEEIYSITKDLNNKKIILYYFWVGIIPCDSCEKDIELFKNRIFVKNAYPKKKPESKAICPNCNSINTTLYNSQNTLCGNCQNEFNPQLGNVKKSVVTCPNCSNHFKLIDHMKTSKKQLEYKMYAKCILNKNRKKTYEKIDKHDLETFQKCNLDLHKFKEIFPTEKIKDGYNTGQILNYNISEWTQLFNSRQLFCIGLLVEEISKIPKKKFRNLFACLLSGTLEFNNMLSSFKGEGTGAVRHAFHHHILKPELMPLEANIWGTSKSSGSFSTLFESRIMKMLDYWENPFEMKLNSKGKIEKIHNLSIKRDISISRSFSDFKKGNDVYLNTGDSSKTDIEDGFVDYVVTDPPFFDNVHYSELADFFWVWIKKMNLFKNFPNSTRTNNEVQSTSMITFTEKLSNVFLECNRVLKNDGLLIFTFHHSKINGWMSIYNAIKKANFFIITTHPIKSEMGVSVPIQQAKDPITFDLIFVCAKKSKMKKLSFSQIIKNAKKTARNKFNELKNNKIIVNKSDEKIFFIGNVLSQLSQNRIELTLDLMQKIDSQLD
jgi:putative DNA methylase